MPRSIYDPKAYLAKTRNVKAGLTSRTKILSSITLGAKTIAEISEKSDITYGCVAHHLRLLMRERTVSRSGRNRRYVWTLTEFGQQKLMP